MTPAAVPTDGPLPPSATAGIDGDRTGRDAAATALAGR